MKMSNFMVAVSACGAALMLCSCNSKPADWEDAWITQDIVASPAAPDQIRFDGGISDGEWNDAQAYQLSRAEDWGYEKLLPRQRKQEDLTPFERGSFKVKYDAENLYVLADLDDADVVQTAKKDQSHFCGTGDAVAVFVKPADQSACWGLFVTPWGNTATFLYPWAGYSCSAPQQFVPGIRVAVLAREVVDPEKDKAGWVVEMAIPKALLEQTGGVFAPDKEWKILLCRCNYGKTLPSGQLSTTPKLPRTDFRLTEYYATLKFKPSEDKAASEAKPAEEEKKDVEAKPAAESKKADVKPTAEPKKPDVKPVAGPKKPEANHVAEPKKADVKPAAGPKKVEAKPVAEPKK